MRRSLKMYPQQGVCTDINAIPPRSAIPIATTNGNHVDHHEQAVLCPIL